MSDDGRRPERLHTFSSLEEVEQTLRALATHPEPLVAELPRRPGQKAVRFAHLACGVPEDVAPVEVPPPSTSHSVLERRVAALESEVTRLREQLASLERQLGVG